MDTHVDIHETDSEIRVVADLPGVEKDHIDLECDGKTLTISAGSDHHQYDERISCPSGSTNTRPRRRTTTASSRSSSNPPKNRPISASNNSTVAVIAVLSSNRDEPGRRSGSGVYRTPRDSRGVSNGRAIGVIGPPSIGSPLRADRKTRVRTSSSSIVGRAFVSLTTSRSSVSSTSTPRNGISSSDATASASSRCRAGRSTPVASAPRWTLCFHWPSATASRESALDRADVLALEDHHPVIDCVGEVLLNQNERSPVAR